MVEIETKEKRVFFGHFLRSFYFFRHFCDDFRFFPGHGEEALETEKDFSRYGRVNYVLSKRLELLREVERLQSSLNVKGDVSYTCETAGHFYLYQVHARWEEFMNETKQKTNRDDVDFVERCFPFGQFFSNAPKPLFKVGLHFFIRLNVFADNFSTGFSDNRSKKITKSRKDVGDTCAEYLKNWMNFVRSNCFVQVAIERNICWLKKRKL